MADDIPWRPYTHYIPSTVVAVIFAALFGLTTLLHTYQVIKKRTWYFIPLVIGGSLEVIGFIARILSHPNNFSILAPYLISSIFILIAPTLFAASIYIVLGRIILLVDGERYSWMRQKHVTVAFVMGDILSLQLQSTGASLTSGRKAASQNLGNIIIIVGLFAQLAFFALFIIVSASFHYRLVYDKPVKKHISFRYLRWLRFWKRNKSPRPSSSTYASNDTSSCAVNVNELPWKRHLYVLYINSVLILIRSLFRVVEYIQGKDGYLLSKEIYLYVFDAGLMVVVMVLFNWVHPSQITEMYQERLKGDADGETLELQNTSERLISVERRGL